MREIPVDLFHVDKKALNLAWAKFASTLCATDAEVDQWVTFDKAMRKTITTDRLAVSKDKMQIWQKKTLTLKCHL
eukprot:3785536-Ditylum_brightwellii.AAC.1